MGMSYIGWLSSEGEMIKCEGHAHVAVAIDIAKKLYHYDGSRQADEILLQHGWLRISRLIYGDEGITFFTPQVMSEYQLSFLRTIFDNDANMISRKGLHILCENHIILDSELNLALK